MAANVVDIVKLRYLCFVLVGVSFQLCYAIFDSAAKPCVVFKAIRGGAEGLHCRLHGERGMNSAKNIDATLKFPVSAPMLLEYWQARQITGTPNFSHLECVNTRQGRI